MEKIVKEIPATTLIKYRTSDGRIFSSEKEAMEYEQEHKKRLEALAVTRGLTSLDIEDMFADYEEPLEIVIINKDKELEAYKLRYKMWNSFGIDEPFEYPIMILRYQEEDNYGDTCTYHHVLKREELQDIINGFSGLMKEFDELRQDK